MTRGPIPIWFFVLSVVRRADRFLLVHEYKHGQLWYFPAGRVEFGLEFRWHEKAHDYIYYITPSTRFVRPLTYLFTANTQGEKPMKA